MPRISTKNQVTLPVETLAQAGLKAGDPVTIDAEGPDTIVVRRSREGIEAGIGVFDGLYPPDYLKRLREEDWRA